MVFDKADKGIWWDKALSLVDGCTPVSEGCDHCWLRAMDKRFGKDAPPHFRPDRLEIPLRRKKPTVYAIWSDLFHECVSDEEIDRAFAVMALCPQHEFLVPTKRPERMVKYIQTQDGDREPETGCGTRRAIAMQALDISIEALAANPTSVVGDSLIIGEKGLDAWPIPNIMVGTTCENQEQADQRIPHLLEYPGKKFISIEPMLGPVHILGWLPFIDWVICGCESGPKHRPMKRDWVESLRDDCKTTRTAFFFKQAYEGKKLIHAPYLEKRWLELPEPQ